ncbi:hypothetical protein B0T11DRAFT_49776 [Plectosphaerella cucumerina]|uniref:Uncharacterized protein n=1 Tax=Plectosphaerella cucumerina TaxID=40658 RepID=A0A8K0X6L6_9PEZI|nr:hypothetical protein B0T11DRAFT_49776 [Plectosphaerella cucumerina]
MIRRLYDSAIQHTNRLVDHEFIPYHKLPATTSYKDLSSATVGLSKMSIRREGFAVNTAVSNLSRAFLVNELASAAVVLQGRPLLRHLSETCLQRHPDRFHAAHVQFLLKQNSMRGLFDPEDSAKLVRRLQDKSKQVEALRLAGLCKVAMSDYYAASFNFDVALQLGGFKEGNSVRFKKKKTASEAAKVKLLPVDKPPRGSLLQTLCYRGMCHLENAVIHIYRLYDSQTSTSIGNRSVWYEDAIRRGDEPSELDLTKNRETIQRFTTLALNDFLDFLSYLQFTPTIQKRGRKTPPKAGGQSESHRNPGAAPKKKMYAMSELFGPSPPSLSELLPQDDDATKVPRARGAATYHPFLGEALYHLLLCHVVLQTPASILIRYADIAAHIYSICDAFPFTKAVQTPAMEDFEDILEKMSTCIRMPDAWVNREKVETPPPPKVNATVDLKSIPNSTIPDLTKIQPSFDQEDYSVGFRNLRFLQKASRPDDMIPPPYEPAPSYSSDRAQIIGYWVETNAPNGKKKKKKNKKKKKAKKGADCPSTKTSEKDNGLAGPEAC